MVLRGKVFSYPSREPLLQQRYQHTHTVQGTAWKMYLCQVVASISMRSCQLLGLICTDKAVLFSCVLSSVPWVSSVPLCLLSTSDQVRDQAWKSAHQKKPKTWTKPNFQPGQQSHSTKLPVSLSKNGEEGGEDCRDGMVGEQDRSFYWQLNHWG